MGSVVFGASSLAKASSAALLANVAHSPGARDVKPLAIVLALGSFDVQDDTVLISFDSGEVVVGLAGCPVCVFGESTVAAGASGPSPFAFFGNIVEADEVGDIIDSGIDGSLFFGVVDSGKFASPCLAVYHGVVHSCRGGGEEVILSSVGGADESDSGGKRFHR